MKKNTPERIFITVLLTTLVMMMIALVVLVTLLIREKGDDRPSQQVDGTPAIEETTPSEAVSKFLYPTNTTRSSYLSTKGDDVKYLTDEIKSNNTILVDLSTYTSVVEKGADEKIYPASMTKVMTLLVACEMVEDLDKKLVVTQEQVDYKTQLGASGNPFVAGEGVRIEDLLYLLIYDSDTIACLALADHFAGSEEAFAELMTNKAREMGLTSTSFKNSTGLFHEAHYSTCREMAAIMAYAFENPLAKKILTEYAGYSFDVYDGESETVTRTLTAWSDWYSGRFSDNPKINKGAVVVKSGKTGWEEIPKACFITYAETSSGNKYINVVVGRSNAEQPSVSSSDSTADVKKIYSSYAK